MIFAFFEEIDGPPGRARSLGTRGGNGLVFGRRPRARIEPGCDRPADFTAGGAFWGAPVSPDDAKAQPHRRRADAAGPSPTGARRRRWDGSSSRPAARLA